MISIKMILAALEDSGTPREICKSLLWNLANQEFQKIIDSGDHLETKLDRLAELRDEWKEQERILNGLTSRGDS